MPSSAEVEPVSRFEAKDGHEGRSPDVGISSWPAAGFPAVGASGKRVAARKDLIAQLRQKEPIELY